MDEPLKHLMQELGNAINDSLSESDRIAEAIGEIKRAGYDVFLVLEATVGFHKREEDEEDLEGILPDYGDSSNTSNQPKPKSYITPTGKVKFTSQDHRFLHALKINAEDQPDQNPNSA